ncbi:hypothetical protein [Persicitalea jodogahamensis]|uniref:Uncharacterized protein n=1 Tax=Persicitalea jodogahamensis TaxID=402147 RepID=A0A8J3D995_9BACT|nr:hypothetical protein [Persicitalea jodogahamensis]GHB63936.1 hypothetical protein GCM10007390_17240 [Persicitalea jodogahamensis]
MNDETKPNPYIALLRECSLWTDAKGRKLLVWRLWRSLQGPPYKVEHLDLLILDDMAFVRRSYSELVTLINDGRMVYDRDVVEKVIKLPSGVVAV